MNRSPGPGSLVASSTSSTASTSARLSSTARCMRSVSASRGRWKPGRSASTSCAPGTCTTPRRRRLVVCGLSETIATWSRQSAFVSVDLPTFGRPASPTNPLRNAGSSRAGPPSSDCSFTPGGRRRPRPAATRRASRPRPRPRTGARPGCAGANSASTCRQAPHGSSVASPSWPATATALNERAPPNAAENDRGALGAHGESRSSRSRCWRPTRCCRPRDAARRPRGTASTARRRGPWPGGPRRTARVRRRSRLVARIAV